MSAFLVSDGTIDRVVSLVFAFRNQAIEGDNADKFGARLYRLNMEALRQRYNDKPTRFTYKHREHQDDTTLAQFKALECLIYQCSEGNVPEKPLYQELDAISEALTEQWAKKLGGVVQHSEAWSALPWDFND